MKKDFCRFVALTEHGHQKIVFFCVLLQIFPYISKLIVSTTPAVASLDVLITRHALLAM
jgi:hypothetical protein